MMCVTIVKTEAVRGRRHVFCFIGNAVCRNFRARIGNHMCIVPEKYETANHFVDGIGIHTG